MAKFPNSADGIDTVALTGARGIVGQFVRRYFADKGIHIRGLSRRVVTPTPGESITWITGDMSQSSLTNLCEGADALVHCGFAHTPGRYRGGEGDDPQGFWTTNLAGTVNAIEAARRQGLARIILLSSRAVFGGGDKTPLYVGDEDNTYPDTHYGALKVACESLAQTYTRSYPELVVASLRPTGVYGLLDHPAQSKWFDYARAAIAGEAITDVRCATEVHGLDVASAIHHLLSAPGQAVSGRAFNCSDLLLTTLDIAQGLGQRTGSRAPLPEAGLAPRGQMHCRGLASLGWQGGGRERFNATLDALIKAAS